MHLHKSKSDKKPTEPPSEEPNITEDIKLDVEEILITEASFGAQQEGTYYV